jgi:hypothetical protein
MSRFNYMIKYFLAIYSSRYSSSDMIVELNDEEI